MSLARGFTKRMKTRTERPDAPAAASGPARSQALKSPGLAINRAKISSPVALLSTTNMLSYNAPDIATLRLASSTSSTHSADDSDHSAFTTRSRSSSHGSRETLTDASSVDSSPVSPAPNHLSGFFPPAAKVPRKSASSGNLQQVKEDMAADPIPAIPERALSHSKRAHERLAQKRSLQNIKPRGQLHSNRASIDMFKGTIQEESHPFGKELEQLNEVVEEFGGVVRDAEYEADMAVMQERGLASLCAADYLSEIRPLFTSRFGAPRAMAWI